GHRRRRHLRRRRRSRHHRRRGLVRHGEAPEAQGRRRMTAFLAWAFSGVGRTVLKWAGLAAVMLGFLWKVYDAGKDSARTEQQERDLEALRERNIIDDKVASTPDA